MKIRKEKLSLNVCVCIFMYFICLLLCFFFLLFFLLNETIKLSTGLILFFVCFIIQRRLIHWISLHFLSCFSCLFSHWHRWILFSNWCVGMETEQFKSCNLMFDYCRWCVNAKSVCKCFALFRIEWNVKQTT